MVQMIQMIKKPGGPHQLVLFSFFLIDFFFYDILRLFVDSKKAKNVPIVSKLEKSLKNVIIHHQLITNFFIHSNLAQMINTSYIHYSLHLLFFITITINSVHSLSVHYIFRQFIAVHRRSSKVLAC